MRRFGRESDLRGMLMLVNAQPFYEVQALEIYPNNVVEHEELARQLFGLLSSFLQ